MSRMPSGAAAMLSSKVLCPWRAILQSAFAQAERDNIHQRQAEGIAAAKARGVTFGPAPQERPAEFEGLKREWEAGKLSARQAALRLGICHKTFLKWARK